jgi:hypothetical protein
MLGKELVKRKARYISLVNFLWIAALKKVLRVLSVRTLSALFKESQNRTRR